MSDSLVSSQNAWFSFFFLACDLILHIINAMRKKILLGVVSMLFIGLSSQVALAQRISVSDFDFFPNLPRETAISLHPGQSLNGTWISPYIQVHITGNWDYEAVLRVYKLDSDVPVMTKLMDRNPVIQGPSTSVWPPVQSDRRGYSVALNDKLSAGSYVAQVDIYATSINLPKEPGWVKWEYSPEPIWAKLVGSSGMNFTLTSKDAILYKTARVNTSFSVQAIPAPRSTPAMRSRLNAFATSTLNAAYNSIRPSMVSLGNAFRVDQSLTSTVIDGPSAPFSRNLLLVAPITSTRVKELQSAVGQSNIFNQFRSIPTPDGSVIVRINSSVVVE